MLPAHELVNSWDPVLPSIPLQRCLCTCPLLWQVPPHTSSPKLKLILHSTALPSQTSPPPPSQCTLGGWHASIASYRAFWQDSLPAFLSPLRTVSASRAGRDHLLSKGACMPHWKRGEEDAEMTESGSAQPGQPSEQRFSNYGWQPISRSGDWTKEPQNQFWGSWWELF